MIEFWNQLHPALQIALSFVYGLAGIYFMMYSFFFYYKLFFKRDEFLAEQNGKYQRILEETKPIYQNKIAK